MKRPAGCLLLMVLGLAACATTAVPPAGTVLPAAARESPARYLVVTVRNDATSGGQRAAGTARGYDSVVPYAATSSARALADGIAADYGLQQAASWPIALLGVHCIVYEVPASDDPAQLLQRMARDRRVESVQPLGTFATQSAAYNDPYAGLQRSLAQMGVAQAQQWSRGDAVRLAVIDTGIDSHHPDLRGRIAEERNFVDADVSAFHADLHGTAVAGVIAAVANNHIGIAGIAPGVRLLAYKACWKDAGGNHPAVCNTFTLAQALAAAIDARADIVNLSLAGPADALLARIVERGLQRGIIFIGAAPPAGADSGFPGDVRGVVTVDAPGRRSGTAAALTAPGNDVLTLVPGAHYDFASGSSFAAAQVSAVTALLISRDRKLDGADLQRLLARTAQIVVTAAGGYNMVNACAALVALQRQGSCMTEPTTELPVEPGHLQEAARSGD
jgi:hypothetical protein